jgi:hypothetical protein
MLQAVYEKVNNIFDVSANSEKDYYQWLFYDESKEATHAAAVQDYIKNCNYYNQHASFSITEKKLLPLILPADILMRYLYTDADPYKLTTSVIENIFDKKTIENYIHSFRKNDDQLESFL